MLKIDAQNWDRIYISWLKRLCSIEKLVLPRNFFRGYICSFIAVLRGKDFRSLSLSTSFLHLSFHPLINKEEGGWASARRLCEQPAKQQPIRRCQGAWAMRSRAGAAPCLAGQAAELLCVLASVPGRGVVPLYNRHTRSGMCFQPH